ncbi:MAG: Gfo/Idh/MocA family oxidoreductase [Planctomycetota bacterium]|nr:Gfo/Idh/MocA family oxidoreductase [Planctomycetota bacterium]
MRDIGVAVLGTGFMGRVHVEALRRAGVGVRGALGSSAEKSRAFAERHGLAQGYRDFDAVLADREVHAVHVGTPNRLHFAQVRAALEAGKHVLCEKPLALNAEESARLVELATKRPRQAAGVNYNLRYYPLCLEARARVRAGELGRVFHVAGSYVQDWLLRESDYNWRVLEGEGGALRAVADIGTHWLDLAHAVTGLEVEAVCADLATVHPARRRPRCEVETFQGKGRQVTETEPVEITTDDYGAILLRFAGGARGSLWVSQVTAGRKNALRLELAGSRRALAWESERPNELWLGERDGPNGLLLKDPSLLGEYARRAADNPGGHNEGYADTFKQLFRDFYGYIAAGNFDAPPPYPTFADGHREMRLCEAVLDSHRRGGWVTLKGAHA